MEGILAGGKHSFGLLINFHMILRKDESLAIIIVSERFSKRPDLKFEYFEKSAESGPDGDFPNALSIPMLLQIRNLQQKILQKVLEIFLIDKGSILFSWEPLFELTFRNAGMRIAKGIVFLKSLFIYPMPG